MNQLLQGICAAHLGVVAPAPAKVREAYVAAKDKTGAQENVDLLYRILFEAWDEGRATTEELETLAEGLQCREVKAVCLTVARLLERDIRTEKRRRI